MAVGIHRQLNRCVPKTFLNNFRMNSGPEKNRGARVPQSLEVEAFRDFGQLLQRLPDSSIEITLPQEIAVTIREHEFAVSETFQLHEFSMRRKCFDR